jgi:alpha-tubulin suppressor-like RCC1 family protein
MFTFLGSAHSRSFGFHRVLCFVLLSSNVVGCINKGDTNIDRDDEVKAQANDTEEDSGVRAPGSRPGADDDSAQNDDDVSAPDEDDDVSAPDEDDDVSAPVEPSPEPESPQTSGGNGGNANDEAGGEAGVGGSGGAASGGSAGATTDAPCAAEDIPVSVSAGRYSTCGITANGTVKCWGSNAVGQLGTGDFESSSIPVSVKGLCARSVAVGSDHACAIDLDGGVQCWGYNMWGQLGNGRDPNSPLPSEVEIAGVEQVTAGGSHTCALTEGGEVYCWGYNGYGQLGDASTDESNVPVLVQGLDDDTIVQITAGTFHTCAVLDDGSAKCWGNGGSGQLGNEMITGAATLPQPVLALADATQISAGNENTCARIAGGTVACWGVTPEGPNFNDGFVGAVPYVAAAFIAAGGTFTCTLNTNGGVSCWGTNDRGQVGVGSATRNYDSPQELGGDTQDAIALTLGYEHGCVVLPGDIVKCWGRGDSGQLGTGSAVDSTAPTEVQLFP